MGVAVFIGAQPAWLLECREDQMPEPPQDASFPGGFCTFGCWF